MQDIIKLVFILGVSGGISTILHDAIMNPAEGKHFCLLYPNISDFNTKTIIELFS